MDLMVAHVDWVKAGKTVKLRRRCPQLLKECVCVCVCVCVVCKGICETWKGLLLKSEEDEQDVYQAQ